jgi:hypothetical protein
VRAVQDAPAGFAGVSPPRQSRTGSYGVSGAAEDMPAAAHIDPGEYLDLQPVGALRHDHDDDLSSA